MILALNCFHGVDFFAWYDCQDASSLLDRRHKHNGLTSHVHSVMSSVGSDNVSHILIWPKENEYYDISDEKYILSKLQFEI